MSNDTSTAAHILLIDDRPENLNVLCDALEAAGYRILCATSGEKGLEIVSKRKPDLILLDIVMPEMDGFETCRRLKANEGTRDIPVLFISAKGEAEDAAQVYLAGGEDYIGKPFVVAEVLAKVRTHLALAYANAALKLRRQTGK